jgi:hypothetical protein
VSFAGLNGVSAFVVNEAKPLFAGMKADGAAAFLVEHCSHVSAVGFGVGGAVAELFAAVANRDGDPAGLRMQVDSVFTYGALPVATSSLNNDLAGSGGCFPGARYVLENAAGQEDPLVATASGLVHPNTTTVYMAAAGIHTEYACGSPVPARTAGALAELHVASVYNSFVGCSVNPTPAPTQAPTKAPTAEPTAEPTTAAPTAAPTAATEAPTTAAPTEA